MIAEDAYNLAYAFLYPGICTGCLGRAEHYHICMLVQLLIALPRETYVTGAGGTA